MSVAKVPTPSVFLSPLILLVAVISTCTNTDENEELEEKVHSSTLAIRRCRFGFPLEEARLLFVTLAL